MADEADGSPPAPKRAKLSENIESTDNSASAPTAIASGNNGSEWSDGWSREIECGITTFINKNTAPFKSIFKHRYVFSTLITFDAGEVNLLY